MIPGGSQGKSAEAMVHPSPVLHQQPVRPITVEFSIADDHIKDVSLVKWMSDQDVFEFSRSAKSALPSDSAESLVVQALAVSKGGRGEEFSRNADEVVIVVGPSCDRLFEYLADKEVTVITMESINDGVPVWYTGIGASSLCGLRNGPGDRKLALGSYAVIQHDDRRYVIAPGLHRNHGEGESHRTRQASKLLLIV